MTAHETTSIAGSLTKAAAEKASRWEKFIKSSTELLAYGARKLVRDRAQQLAAALAYRTVFSLVPILVLALVAVRAVSTPEDLRSRLNSLMGYLGLGELSFELPPEISDPEATHRRVVLSEVIDHFATNQLSQLGQVNFTAIAAVGVVILIYGAISLVVQVEQAFNLICRAPAGRRLTSRLVNYWTLLTLGAVALYLSFTLGGRFGAALLNLPPWLAWATQPVQIFVRVTVTWTLLMFAYLQMPNTRVRFKPASFGAFVAASMWECCKTGLTWFVTNATSGKVSVYGSLALLPIFLLWIYVTWLIVLFGLELASILQTVRHASILDRRFASRRPTPTVVDSSIAIQALVEIARRFRDGRPMRLDELAVNLGLSEEQAALLAGAAVEAGMVHAIENEAEPDVYSLARPAEKIGLGEAFAAFDRLTPMPQEGPARDSLRTLRKRQRADLADQTLASLLEASTPPSSPPGAPA